MYQNDQPFKNRAARQAYNDHVEKHGVFSEGLRSF